VIYRIIDVNLNRLREGLKTCEDIIRFHYEDKKLLASLRKIRLSLLPLAKRIGSEVIPFRATEKDLGKKEDFDQLRRKDIADIFFANIKRAEEACRTLEEFGRLRMETLPFKKTRFALYELEKEFAQRYGKRLKLNLYAILDIESLPKFFKKVPPLSELGFILANGCDVIQFRGRKDVSTQELLKGAEETKRGIEKAKRRVLFLINDRIDIALACGADGVHLGKEDIPWQKARELLPDKIIGATVRNLSDLRIAEESGCDYVGCGSVFPSPTKPSAKVIGLERLRRIVERSSRPVVAIGGINPNNLQKVLKTGVCGVALLSALFANGKLRENLSKVKRIMGSEVRTNRRNRTINTP
jgi:thiamine-phosphate pyrophosphorylase